MNPISRLDRLVAQLRTQLERQPARASAGAGARTQASVGSSSGPDAEAAAVSRVRELGAAGVSDERVLVTHLVEGLLKGELGQEAVQGAQFQQALVLVVDTLQDDPETWALCRACVAEALR